MSIQLLIEGLLVDRAETLERQVAALVQEVHDILDDTLKHESYCNHSACALTKTSLRGKHSEPGGAPETFAAPMVDMASASPPMVSESIGVVPLSENEGHLMVDKACLNNIKTSAMENIKTQYSFPGVCIFSPNSSPKFRAKYRQKLLCTLGKKAKNKQFFLCISNAGLLRFNGLFMCFRKITSFFNFNPRIIIMAA